MLPYRDALDQILSLPFALGKETVPLLQAHGRVLAAPIPAPWPLPRFDNSAMDGFAMRAADAATAPVELPIAGESAAGHPFPGTVPPGHAIRISTGAKVPAGLDGIVPIEKAEAIEGGAAAVRLLVAPTSGAFIRARGSDIAEGQELFPAGTPITPAVLAFLSSFNIEEVTVYKRPRVAVLTSGDEVKELGTPLRESDIVASSLYFLEEELRHCGCEPRLFGIAPDDADQFRARFEEALAWGDLLVTTAGVSVGGHDVVHDVIAAQGGTVHFWRVAVRPGKPMLVATYGGKHHFGFPGNPVSTCCNTELFLKPFLRRAFGITPAEPPTERLPLATACPRDKGRLFFVYCTDEIQDGQRHLRPLPRQNSGNLYLVAQATYLAVVDPGPDEIPAGEKVEAMALRRELL